MNCGHFYNELREKSLYLTIKSMIKGKLAEADAIWYSQGIKYRSYLTKQLPKLSLSYVY